MSCAKLAVCGLFASDLSSQVLAPFGPASAQQSPPRGGGRSFTKTVDPFAAAIVGLIGAFH
jgi:hypothetical protein